MNIICLNEVNNEAECLAELESNNSQGMYSAPCGGVPLSEDERNPVNTDQACEDGRNSGNGDQGCEDGRNLGNGDQACEHRPNTANQPNTLSSSTGPYLNPDILEIIRQILCLYPLYAFLVESCLEII